MKEKATAFFVFLKRCSLKNGTLMLFNRKRRKKTREKRRNWTNCLRLQLVSQKFQLVIIYILFIIRSGMIFAFWFVVLVIWMKNVTRIIFCYQGLIRNRCYVSFTKRGSVRKGSSANSRMIWMCREKAKRLIFIAISAIKVAALFILLFLACSVIQLCLALVNLDLLVLVL